MVATQQLHVLSHILLQVFFFSSRRRHTRFKCDWSSDVCSSDLTSPTCPIVSSATSRANPGRLAASAADRPRSSSITITREAAQPSATARSASPYCSRVDSPWSATCWREDCRTYTAASRSRCQPWILPSPCSYASIMLTPGPLRRRHGRDRQPLQEHAQQSHTVLPGHLRTRPPQLPPPNRRP